MFIPERDKKTKKDIIEYMKKCAKQYVPEWRYDEENPDAGTTMVSLFADMMCDNIKRFNQTAIGDMLGFFDEVNADVHSARPAEGYITFELPDGLQSESEVPKETKIAADSADEPLIFETMDDVLVKQLKIDKIFYSNPKDDTICKLFDAKTEEQPSFYLFQNGQENLQKHEIYFCFEKGMEIYTRAVLDLFLKTESGFADEETIKKAITNDSKIKFYYGTKKGYEQIKNYIYEEDRIQFVIDHSMSCFCKKEDFDGMYVLKAEILDAKFFSDIYITEVSLSVKGENLRPESINVNGTDQTEEEFAAFGEALAPYNELYIASGEVFGKSGANISIGFDLDFVKIPLENVVSQKMTWKIFMKKRDFVPEEEFDITIREVIWEYFNGYGWKRLKSADKYKEIFKVNENMLGQRKKMEFVCPDDIQPVLVNSAETYYIRARIVKMNNEFKTNGAYIVPVVGNFSLNYDYCDAPISSFSMMRNNNLEEEIISKEKMRKDGFAAAFSTLRTDKKPATYLGLSNPPVGGPLKMLFIMHESMQKSTARIEWEYSDGKEWKKINVVDGTNSFQHTGIVSWFGNSDVNREQIFSENMYWIRITEVDVNKKNYGSKDVCPKIEGIYPNSTRILGVETVEENHTFDPHSEEKIVKLYYQDIVDISVYVLEKDNYDQGMTRNIWEEWTEIKEIDEGSQELRCFSVNRSEGIVTFPKYMDTAEKNEQNEIEVKIKYTYCRGDKGNLPARTVNRLTRTIGFISNCYNPIATVGGIARERVAEAVKRNAKTLRHGYRCVSAADYEDMAFEATRNISKIKCFCGYDYNREAKDGTVTLVVLPKENPENAFGFEKVKAQMYEYLSKHMDENIIDQGKFFIVKAELIRMDVKVSLELTNKKDIFITRKNVLEELERFLDPLQGNFDKRGWEIGMLPNKNQIINALKVVDGVKYIKQLTVRKYRRGYFEDAEISEEEFLPFYYLPKSGKHEIRIDL